MKKSNVLLWVVCVIIAVCATSLVITSCSKGPEEFHFTIQNKDGEKIEYQGSLDGDKNSLVLEKRINGKVVDSIETVEVSGDSKQGTITARVNGSERKYSIKANDNMSVITFIEM